VNIVAADRHARVLREDEVHALLAEPIVMHLAVVDDEGWPLVHPVWHVFEDGVFRLAVGTTSRKARLLRASGRAYFSVDQGGGAGSTRGVRGRADVRMIGDDRDRAIDVTRKELLKYTGTDRGPYADEMLSWARDGEISVVELRVARLATFSY
jgi:hypothetical protein